MRVLLACALAARSSTGWRWHGAELARHARARVVGNLATMKGKFGHTRFNVNMWYPDADRTQWISAYATHHAKLQKLELEVERCEYLLDEAVQMEEYDEADGLRARIKRLRDMHPIWSVEEDLANAISASDFSAAQRLHDRLEDIRWNLGLPRFLLGQVVSNVQAEIRGVIVSVDTSCQMRDDWLRRCLEANALRLDSGVDQPWYTILVDERDDELTPRELYMMQQNRYSSAARPPIHLPQEAIALCHDAKAGLQHELLKFLFESATPEPAPAGVPVGLGLRLKPTIKLRLWQRTQHERAARAYGSSI
ncbi:hypothetical protein KFE25_003110 [Diacronema lutheri]|uniref:Hemimethylated DNA-binding domain-containing protein n=2 Tax=Diacronema lutheri TaxID=2081491 RepID=A0A8J5XD35_DIALT|nr:hypothetical protein KFE25_003110 [Diacronema lutheri]